MTRNIPCHFDITWNIEFKQWFSRFSHQQYLCHFPHFRNILKYVSNLCITLRRNCFMLSHASGQILELFQVNVFFSFSPFHFRKSLSYFTFFKSWIYPFYEIIVSVEFKNVLRMLCKSLSFLFVKIRTGFGTWSPKPVLSFNRRHFPNWFLYLFGSVI